jgi:hypothetical protein
LYYWSCFYSLLEREPPHRSSDPFADPSCGSCPSPIPGHSVIRLLIFPDSLERRRRGQFCPAGISSHLQHQRISQPMLATHLLVQQDVGQKAPTYLLLS